MVDPTSPVVTAGMNALKVILHPDGFRRFLVNWDQVAAAAINRLDHEIAERPADEALLSLRTEILTYPDVTDLCAAPRRRAAADSLLMPFHYQVGGNDLKLFSTIATIGGAHDITLEELRLETFFAADEETERLLRSGIL